MRARFRGKAATLRAHDARQRVEVHPKKITVAADPEKAATGFTRNMPGHTRHAAGGGQRRSPTTAIGHRLAQMYIGHCLAQMYEGFVRSPPPERLTQLLDEIERAEHAAAESRSLGQLERFLAHARWF